MTDFKFPTEIVDLPSQGHFYVQGHPLSSGKDQQVHIQSTKFRFEMDKKDYVKYALAILVAEKNLKNLKVIK